MTKTMQVVTASGYLATFPLPLDPNRIEGGAYDSRRNVWTGYVPHEKPSIDACVKAVAAFHGLEIEEIYIKTREPRISHPRQLAYMLIRETTGESYTRIAAAFSCDHTSVIHGIQAARERLKRSNEMMGDYIDLRERFVAAPVNNLPPLPAVVVKPEAEKRICSCGAMFETLEDYRFCDPCRRRMNRNAGGF